MPVLVQVMAWRQIGDKPLPEPMMTKLNVIGPKYINTMKPRQNGRDFSDDILQVHFTEWKHMNSIQISLRIFFLTI